MKLTPWYPGHIKPARSGVYQQLACKQIGYMRWDGLRWYLWDQSKEVATRCAWPADLAYQNDPWRGLAEDPSESGPGGFFQSREALDMGETRP